ncbi:hypothetical protein BCR43DRAFT_243130 [Syncephalastrum racemosum]|uniref:G-protein coupled receptors family 1 profile domain-containing protein n=1 Tax=Syncephalastrum racemosum TaxID=13706 RepID=A0A1X2HF51_SYNRA|nr:hypothetical protein BCR43DRAFT_243130 [Syncephalastrum racemosum]
MSKDWYYEITVSEESFPYTRDQISVIAKITICFMAISFVASSLVLLFWLLMWYIERPQLNRVSLRCVAMASAINLIDGIFDIVMWSINANETTCRGLSLTVDFLDILNVSLLAVIGINLVLVVVLSVKKRDKLERYYYPCIFVYSAIVIVAPLYEEIVTPMVVPDTIGCWYYDNVAERGYSRVSWMWFYGFVFLATVVGLGSVLVAIAYLARAERAVRNDMEIARRSSHPSISSAFRRSSAINQPRVVLRCILYPLVPLIVHIWGFTVQLIVTVNNPVPIWLVVMLLDQPRFLQ